MRDFPHPQLAPRTVHPFAKELLGVRDDVLTTLLQHSINPDRRRNVAEDWNSTSLSLTHDRIVGLGGERHIDFYEVISGGGDLPYRAPALIRARNRQERRVAGFRTIE